MAVRVIYYTNEDLIKYGDLELRRSSAVFDQESCEFEDVFRLDEQKVGWILTPLHPAVKPLFHDEKLISEPMHIKNGFSFNSSDTFYKIIAEFPKAKRSSANKIFFRFTALLTALILIAEAVLVIWVPQYLEERSDLYQKVLIQRCGEDIDQMRTKLRRWETEKKDMTLPAVGFLLRRLNSVAEYFRRNRELFSPEEVQLMRKRLDAYLELIGRLETGIDFDQKVEPDIDGWIERNCKIEQ